jgi:hypothetical protein
MFEQNPAMVKLLGFIALPQHILRCHFQLYIQFHSQCYLHFPACNQALLQTWDYKV